MIDTVIADRYRVDEQIGQGSFARVYRGFDLDLKRPVAIKVFNAQFSGDFSQARIRIEHPAEVTFRSVASQPGIHWIAGLPSNVR